MKFSFWNQATCYLRNIKPESLDTLGYAVKDFTATVDEEAIWKMCRHTKKRALTCVQAEATNLNIYCTGDKY